MLYYINDSLSLAVPVQIEGTPITTMYSGGDIMTNPAASYGICRVTVFTSTGGPAGAITVSSGVYTLTDPTGTATTSFNSGMVGMNVALSQNGVFIGYYAIATFVSATAVTLSGTPSTATGLTWALVASSNGVPVQDLPCYRDSTTSGQGDLIISYGFQLPDKYTIVPVYGVHTSSGALNWHQQAKQTVRVNALATDVGGVVVANMPS